MLALVGPPTRVVGPPSYVKSLNARTAVGGMNPLWPSDIQLSVVSLRLKTFTEAECIEGVNSFVIMSRFKWLKSPQGRRYND